MASESRQKYPRVRTVRFGQHLVTLYSIGWLAKVAGMRPVTIRLWTRKKVLPNPITKHVAGSFHWYTAGEINDYGAVCAQRNAGEIPYGMAALQQQFTRARTVLLSEYKLLRAGQSVLPARLAYLLKVQGIDQKMVRRISPYA